MEIRGDSPWDPGAIFVVIGEPSFTWISVRGTIFTPGGDGFRNTIAINLPLKNQSRHKFWTLPRPEE